MIESISTSRSHYRTGKHRVGFTLTELLVVISILAILIGMLLPAVQSIRERSRMTQCQNNLRQLGLAAQLHESAFRHLPTNGWGYRWVGQAKRGFGSNQPGGWIYNLLPYIEQNGLRQTLMVGSNGLIPADRFDFDFPTVRCPSRPGNTRGQHGATAMPLNTDPLELVAKSDYAINEGDFVTNTRDGPESSSTADVRAYDWTDTRRATGVSYQRSQVKYSFIVDGLSATYFCGEKYVPSKSYFDDSNPGHDQSALCGVDIDIARWTHVLPRYDGTFGNESLGPNADIRAFGSAHRSGFSMVYCDGSVRTINYNVDSMVHRSAGHRSDAVSGISRADLQLE